MTKKTLRQKVLKDLHAMDCEERNEFELSLHHHFLNWLSRHNFQTIGCYFSFPPEVDTHRLMKQLSINDYQLALPKTYPNSQMVFHQFQWGDKLESSFGSLKEPIASSSIIKKDDLDVILVPGVLFDQDGNRIGFGKGYYDRYLENYKGETVSLLFPCQIVDKGLWEVKLHDIAVKHLLIAEKGSEHATS